MTEDHDEIRDIGDIDEYEANEFREMVRKVNENPRGRLLRLNPIALNRGC
jgi:cell fate (sporulation/competence/biofilm development) regulator YlbF (YheA/YmcA/DUF963 family)